MVLFRRKLEHNYQTCDADRNINACLFSPPEQPTNGKMVATQHVLSEKLAAKVAGFPQRMDQPNLCSNSNFPTKRYPNNTQLDGQSAVLPFISSETNTWCSVVPLPKSACHLLPIVWLMLYPGYSSILEAIPKPCLRMP